MRQSRFVRASLRFRACFGARSDPDAVRTARQCSDAAVGQHGGPRRHLVFACHIPAAVSMCTGLLSRCARNRLPGLAEAEQLDPAERPRSSIAETTAERTELRPTNGGAPRPRCTRNGLDAPPWFWRESPPGASRRPGPVAAWTRRGLDQALVLGDADGAGPGVDAELGEDIDEVTLHGRLGDEQLLGDL